VLAVELLDVALAVGSVDVVDVVPLLAPDDCSCTSMKTISALAFSGELLLVTPFVDPLVELEESVESEVDAVDEPDVSPAVVAPVLAV
jgi:hypothetical protein